MGAELAEFEMTLSSGIVQSGVKGPIGAGALGTEMAFNRGTTWEGRKGCRQRWDTPCPEEQRRRCADPVRLAEELEAGSGAGQAGISFQ